MNSTLIFEVNFWRLLTDLIEISLKWQKLPLYKSTYEVNVLIQKILTPYIHQLMLTAFHCLVLEYGQEHLWLGPNPIHAQKWKSLFDKILVTGCTGNCHFDNFQGSQWQKFHQHYHIPISVFIEMALKWLGSFRKHLLMNRTQWGILSDMSCLVWWSRSPSCNYFVVTTNCYEMYGDMIALQTVLGKRGYVGDWLMILLERRHINGNMFYFTNKNVTVV